VICNDIGNEPALAPLRAELLARSHHSLAAFPLIVEDRAVAVIELFANDVGFFAQAGKIALLEELAGDLSFGLQFIDKEDRLNYLAYYDAFTGLPNSMLFHDRLTQHVLATAGSGDMAAVILIDLSHFAQLNDALGRHVGDAVLKMVAQRLRSALQEPYSLARISGDTFAIAFSGLQRAADAAALLEQQVLQPLNQPFAVGASGSPYFRARRRGALSGRWTRCGNLVQACRAGIEEGQVVRRTLLVLFAANERGDRRQGGARKCPQGRVGSGAIRDALSTARRSAQRQDHRGRSADPLAASAARHNRAGRIHSDGGRDRPDRRNRRLG